jgi:hypothetical protein
MNYYGRFYRSQLSGVLARINSYLMPDFAHEGGTAVTVTA